MHRENAQDQQRNMNGTYFNNFSETNQHTPYLHRAEYAPQIRCKSNSGTLDIMVQNMTKNQMQEQQRHLGHNGAEYDQKPNARATAAPWT